MNAQVRDALEFALLLSPAGSCKLLPQAKYVLACRRKLFGLRGTSFMLIKGFISYEQLSSVSAMGESPCIAHLSTAENAASRSTP